MATANPFAPAAAAAPTAQAAPAAAPAAGGDTKTRKKPAKQLTPDQTKEIMQRAFAGETPSQIAQAMGIERNQSYRIIKSFKDMAKEKLEDPATPADVKAAIQANLDRIPAREFGSTSGATRTSSTKATLEDLLTAAI